MQSTASTTIAEDPHAKHQMGPSKVVICVIIFGILYRYVIPRLFPAAVSGKMVVKSGAEKKRDLGGMSLSTSGNHLPNGDDSTTIAENEQLGSSLTMDNGESCHTADEVSEVVVSSRPVGSLVNTAGITRAKAKAMIRQRNAREMKEV